MRRRSKGKRQSWRGWWCWKIPPWEKRDPGGVALAKAEALREHLPGFTSYFTRWIAGKADDVELQKVLSSGFASNSKGYREKLSWQGSKSANTGRIVQNWAVLATVYQLLRDFMAEYDAVQLLPLWEDNIGEMVQAVQGERAGQLFLDVLGQLLASGSCRLETLGREFHDPVPGSTIVGYRDERFAYLLPNVALNHVNRAQTIHFNSSAIAGQLKEDGVLVASGSDNHHGVQIRINGSRVRVWRLKAESLGGDAGDSGDGSE